MVKHTQTIRRQIAHKGSVAVGGSLSVDSRLIVFNFLFKKYDLPIIF